VLMRTMRGAGARGLAGLYAASGVLRPLIAFRRAALAAYANERQVVWVDDPTNESRAFLRNRVRHDILPALRRANPAIDRELLEVARRAADWRRETETIAHVVSEVSWEAGAVDVAVGAIADLEADHLAVLWPAVAARIGATLDRRGISRVSAFSVRSRVGARMQLSGGWEVVRSRHALRLQSTAPRVLDEAALSASAPTAWGDWTFWAADSERIVSPDGGDRSEWSATLPTDQPLRIREWRAGDRLARVAGVGGRKVKRLLTDAGVTGHEKSGWPVVLCGDRIVWIPGVRRSAAATLRSGGGRPSLTFSCARHRG
jgi:tRNA(Ile)-lysidine synthase